MTLNGINGMNIWYIMVCVANLVVFTVVKGPYGTRGAFNSCFRYSKTSKHVPQAALDKESFWEKKHSIVLQQIYTFIYIYYNMYIIWLYIYNFRILQVSFSILPTSRSIALRQECQQDLPSGAEHAAVFRPVQTPTKEGRWLVVVTLW